MKISVKNTFLSAAFLMATSAVGPGFLTQTAVFTNQLLASFGFVILVTILLDVVAQLNIWRIIVVAGKRAQDIANEVLPGLGYFLAILVAFGGLAFNIGNIAGSGLGVNILFGTSVPMGAMCSAVLAIGIFLFREAARGMDLLMKVLGLLMIGLSGYVMWQSHPPLDMAVKETVMPQKFDLNAILTLVGGTVGGYITFAGAHRLMDAGLIGRAHVRAAGKSAVTAIGMASVMRIVLFLAALGVVVGGGNLDPSNPAASVFRIASGEIGYKLFGLVLWSAAITSVIGAAYTSISFIKSFHPLLGQYHRYLIIVFILISTGIFILVGQPVKVLVLAGALNGLILPVALAIMLVAVYKKSIVGVSYQHPFWLTALGVLVVVLMGYIGIQSVISGFIR